MKISLNTKKVLPLAIAMSSFLPMKNTLLQNTGDIKPNMELTDNPACRVLSMPRFPSPAILDGLKTQNDTNFVGGISHHFTDNSIKKLKRRILRPENQIEYISPIDIDNNVYSEPFGYYFANRPTKDGNSRPHLGLDFFVTKYALKPKNPVVIKAPLDGVVISQKKARKEDNIISNAITMLGVDGRKYSFDHIARNTDYSTQIPLPEVGTILKAGDSIGYIGSTGETVMWHLHLIIMTDEKLKEQQESEFWKKLAKNDYCPLRGQVNPLNKKEAGPIADVLLKIRGTKKDAIGDFEF